MGKIAFTLLQEIVFDELTKHKDLKDSFYFSGGTALSVFYLYHRYSDDLDFFSERKLDDSLIVSFINTVAKKLGTTAKITKKQTVMWFELTKGRETLKVDFLSFPYRRIGKGITYKGISVDSLKDIGANKLLTLNLKINPKDYVDLYFLLKEKFTIWDLLYAVEEKFRLQLDLISLGEDFLEVEKLEFLPKMVKPLTLPQLKKFFRKKAKEVGRKVIE